MKQGKFKGKIIWLCEICNFGFSDKETAHECEKFCMRRGGCSMEIIKKAVKKA